MFWVGGCPALLALYIRTKVPESEAWKQHKVARVIDGPKIAMQHKRLVLYMVALMFLMNCLSHGTQDLYPDFLKHGHGIAPNTVAYITIFYNIGAVTGAFLFGLLSERIGRRYGMLAALALSLLIMPVWAFGGTRHGAGARCLRHANGSARRLGNHSRAPERTLTQLGARSAAGLHLSDRHSAGGFHPDD